MKFSRTKRVVVWVIVSMPLFSLGADDANALFKKGNAFYQKAQYKPAVDVYQQLLSDGYKSPAIYFNLGNAYYKNDDIPSALLYFEKAHKLAPGDDDINFNLQYVNLKTTDKVTALPELFLTRWWHEFILAFPANSLAVWSIIFIIAGSGALMVYFFVISVLLKKTAFYIALSFFFIGAFAVVIAGSQVSYFENHRQAIIFSPVVNVKNAPSQQAATLFVLHDGTKVNLVVVNNDWIRIKLANGTEGWIRQSDTKEI